VDYTIACYSDAVRHQILDLPDNPGCAVYRTDTQNDCLRTRSRRAQTNAFGEGLFELRLKGAERIARVFYCTLVGRRIVMLHSFVKKSARTPLRERQVAELRIKEIKRANA
jgi:phage-related protein